MRIEWSSQPSPLGPLLVVEGEGRPLMVEFGPRAGRYPWMERLRARQPGVRIEPGPCAAATAWLEAFFRLRPLPFSYPDYLGQYFQISPLEEAVWRALCDIPLGETRSYEQIGQATGLPARLVGQLNGANHLAILVPCHRVVGKNGSLVGYGGGLQKKRWLLDHELRAAGLVLR